jgi:hypothetical protein
MVALIQEDSLRKMMIFGQFKAKNLKKDYEAHRESGSDSASCEEHAGITLHRQVASTSVTFDRNSERSLFEELVHLRRGSDQVGSSVCVEHEVVDYNE